MAAIFVRIIDTMAAPSCRTLAQVLSGAAARPRSPPLSSDAVYLLMAIVLVLRPEGCSGGKAMMISSSRRERCPYPHSRDGVGISRYT